MVNLEYERFKKCQETPTHSRWGEEARLEGLRQVLYVEHLIHVSKCIEKGLQNETD